MTTNLTFGSLFAGIGGMDLGLERAGMTCKWQVEIDDYATRVLEKHWPDVRRFRDVRTVGNHNLESVDLICGGFPCQDISNVGKRAGIEGERSGLWSEYFRLISELRPRYVLVENVSALLVRGLGRVLGDLASCGYDAEWQCIPAASVGAPHIRDRVWVLAYPGRQLGDVQAEHNDGRDIMLSQGFDGQASEWGDDRELVALVPGVHSGTSENWWRTQSRMDRSVNGIAFGMDRLRTLGNTVVPQVAEWIGRRITQTTRAGSGDNDRT